MQSPRRWPLLAFVVGLSVGCQPAVDSRPSGRVAGPTADSAGAAKTAHEQVDLDVLDFAGIGQLIAGKGGKVVVLDCWSTSCAPCMRDFHHLVELHRDFGPERVACISLSFDNQGLEPLETTREPVLKFLRSQGATFDNVLSSDDDEKLYRRFELASVPAVFVYDRGGKLRQRFDGGGAAGEGTTYERVRRLVEELLAEAQ